MNKERAREILKELSKKEILLFQGKTNEELHQALDIAIESLDNEWVDVNDELPIKQEEYYLVDTDFGIEIMKWHENPLSKTSNGNGGYKNVWEFRIDDFENKAYKERFINAWRPLPQPYERKE